MYFLPAADRALDVTAPVEVYRLVGRRPSSVYVDEAMRPTSSSAARHRLSDLVYCRTTAEAGDQIQERRGGTVLVTADGEGCPILLSPPQPLQPATAFTHAQLAIGADREVAAQLLAAGFVIEGAPRRVKRPRRGLTERVFGEHDSLVVDQVPESQFDAENHASPSRRNGNARSLRGQTQNTARPDRYSE